MTAMIATARKAVDFAFAAALVLGLPDRCSSMGVRPYPRWVGWPDSAVEVLDHRLSEA